jgi:hypothetical protein
MLRRRKSKRERRRIRRANRWLKRYRIKSTRKVVAMMVPLQPDMSTREIAEFVKNLQSVANITPK